MTNVKSSGTGGGSAGRGKSVGSAQPARPTRIPAAKAVAEARPEPLSEVRFLTVAEVATMMRVSKMTVYRIVHAGEIPAVRVGRSFRVPEKAVNEYLRAAFIEAG
jgi:excisionase family DNA binding protein